jgi:predicted acylesterase/phospholipase RssA
MEARIPIQGIVASEMGALAAAVACVSGSASELEWRSMKVKDDFVGRGIFGRILGGADSGDRIRNQLESIVGETRIEDCKTPVRIGVREQDGRAPDFIGSGMLQEYVTASMSVASIVEPRPIDGRTLGSPLPLKFWSGDAAASWGPAPVVLVDVVDRRRDVSQDERVYFGLVVESLKSGQKENPKPDLVIRVKLDEFHYLDFSQRKLIEQRGRSAILAHLPEINRLLDRQP